MSWLAIVSEFVTVTVTWSVPVQPPALETVTVYVVVPTGETWIEAVVAPLLHKYAVPPEAVNVAVWLEQMVWSGPAEAAIVPDVFIKTSSVAVQPFEPVTVTV